MMLGASQLLINSVLPPHNVGKKTTLRTSPRIRAAFTRSIFIAVYGFFYEILFSIRYYQSNPPFSQLYWFKCDGLYRLSISNPSRQVGGRRRAYWKNS